MIPFQTNTIDSGSGPGFLVAKQWEILIDANNNLKPKTQPGYPVGFWALEIFGELFSHQNQSVQNLMPQEFPGTFLGKSFQIGSVKRQNVINLPG